MAKKANYGPAIAVHEHSLPYYVAMLQKGKPFGFARYGDGEWMTILGHYGRKNSNGCTFTEELGKKLEAVLANNRPYEHSMLRIARRKLHVEIQEFLERNDVQVYWTLGDVMLNASLRGAFWPVIEQLRQRRIVYVGPPHLKKGLPKHFFDLAGFVHIPPTNAILEQERIEAEIIQAVGSTGADMVGFSSGLHGKVFIDNIWEAFVGEVTMLDFGSMWDGYFKVPSRSYIRKGMMNWGQLRIANTGGTPTGPIRKGQNLTSAKLAEDFKMMSTKELAMLSRVCAELPPQPVVINIGSGAGTSALAIFESRPDARLTTVDKKGDVLKTERKTLARALQNYYRMDYEQIQATSTKAGNEWNGEAPDLVLMDGPHDIPTIMADLHAWVPKMKPGSFLLIHDVGHKHLPDLTKLAEKLKGTYTFIEQERFLIAYQLPGSAPDANDDLEETDPRARVLEQSRELEDQAIPTQQ